MWFFGKNVILCVGGVFNGGGGIGITCYCRTEGFRGCQRSMEKSQQTPRSIRVFRSCWSLHRSSNVHITGPYPPCRAHQRGTQKWVCCRKKYPSESQIGGKFGGKCRFGTD